jgi:hypothetical protein
MGCTPIFSQRSATESGLGRIQSGGRTRKLDCPETLDSRVSEYINEKVLRSARGCHTAAMPRMRRSSTSMGTGLLSALRGRTRRTRRSFRLLSLYPLLNISPTALDCSQHGESEFAELYPSFHQVSSCASLADRHPLAMNQAVDG